MADKYQEILRTYWGYPDFRGIQRDIIESITSGKDTLGLMPTGGGKSITFQVPALSQEGVCIVVTPLIALMKDQVQHLKERGILAEAIYTGLSRSEIIKILENCIFGDIKFLYVSPERLASEIFQTKLRHIKVSFITVDEAHCISQWGYDFRPSYLEISKIREMKPEAPILALTATATPSVVDDIQQQLHFAQPNVYKMSFARKNLAYVVRETADKTQEMLHILKCTEGSAIVYVRSRKRTKEVALLLNQQNISATFYHAGLAPDVKDCRQKEWQADETRVMVATNAFGMGIDKPDVRMVIHIDCPDSLEAYFQEAGRAGRDGLKAYAVLLYNNGDDHKLQKRIADNFPEKEYIKDVYEHLAYFFQVAVGSGMGSTFMFDIAKFCFTYKFFPTRVDAALRLLERSGYIHYEDNPDGKPRVKFNISRNDLYLLENLSPKEDAVITALLRNYGGLFTDYGYIDESLLERVSELNKQQLYMVLKNLSMRHIISFIPRRKDPYITYTQNRVDGFRVIIPTSVWEVRKEQFTKHIESILNYAKNDKVCRSRQLLLYFGEETSAKDCCGICDVCANNRTDKKHAEQDILALLEDGRHHSIEEIKNLKHDSEIIKQALEELVEENQVIVDKDKFFKGGE
nr:ATP-dependent DNA helicase RecQ [uncultured Prevotella sp.]